MASLKALPFPDLAPPPGACLIPLGVWVFEARLWFNDPGSAVLDVPFDEGPPAQLRSRDERALKRLFRDRNVVPPNEPGRHLKEVVRAARVLRDVSP